MRAHQVCFHPELPLIVTGSEDGTVKLWHATTYRLETTLDYRMERVWSVGYIKVQQCRTHTAAYAQRVVCRHGWITHVRELRAAPAAPSHRLQQCPHVSWLASV